MDLVSIFSPISEELALVEQELKRLALRIGSAAQPRMKRAGILSRIVQHPFAVPGKRIRPAIVLLSSHAVGTPEDPRTVIQLATAVEMLHAASLVHDDVIDGSDTRRHQVSLNKKFGNRIAVLAGDILYTQFFSIVTGMTAVNAERRLSILDQFLETTNAMCMGEILAQDAGSDLKAPLGFEEYLEISSDKTAHLFRACCATAGIVSRTDDATIRALGAFGLSFGLVFQMVDDLMDKDAGLDPRVDLPSKVREYAERSRGEARALPPSMYREKLCELLDFVLAQVYC
jgi:geranylgeranyl pyrophosphate synthase